MHIAKYLHVRYNVHMNIDPKKTISLTEARKNIFDIAKDVQKPGSHYVFTENGRPKAVMMSAEEFDSWQETIDVVLHNPDILEDVAEAERDLKEGKTIPFEQVLFEMGFAVADKKGSYVARRSRKKGRKTTR